MNMMYLLMILDCGLCENMFYVWLVIAHSVFFIYLIVLGLVYTVAIH